MRCYKKMYRKIMRQLALFVLSYDKCPIDCRKNYGDLILTSINILMTTIALFAFIGWFILSTI